MREVISFRLNMNNPREAKALNLLKKWCVEGYSVRYVITKALLEQDGTGAESQQAMVDEMNETLK